MVTYERISDGCFGTLSTRRYAVFGVDEMKITVEKLTPSWWRANATDKDPTKWTYAYWATASGKTRASAVKAVILALAEKMAQR